MKRDEKLAKPKLVKKCIKILLRSHLNVNYSSNDVNKSQRFSRKHSPKEKRNMCMMTKLTSMDRKVLVSEEKCKGNARLRGGAKGKSSSSVAQTLQNIKESVTPMINMAIQSGKSHGINMHRGIPNLASGDCAFETIIESINTRSCFGETYNDTPGNYRRLWMGEIEKIAYSEWNGGNIFLNLLFIK